VQRRRPLLSAGCAILLATSSIGATTGGAPSSGPPPVRLEAGTGFAAAGQHVTSDGTAVASFSSGRATISVAGRPGTSVSIQEAPGALKMSMSTTRPKTARDATAYRDSGRSLIGDLAALGMPRDEAMREFGDLATLEGDESVTSSQQVSPPYPRAATQPAATTPYDTQCASINVAEGKITGYGCATFFLVHRDGADWWLTTKMKISAHSNDESWFSPKRLTQLGWRVTWAAGNVLYDWDPYSTRPVGSCVTMTVKSSSPWGDVSVQGNICPDSLGPWSVTTARSGGIWNGMERGTDWEGALATQAVHSPPGAPVAYQSAWTLSYCDLWCN
jgi:hypothetical protein